MPVLTVERRISAPVDRVYALARDVERFPEIMPDVESVEILSREGSNTTSRWVGVVRQFNRRLVWVEEDRWDNGAHTCEFRQTEGDFARYEGSWEFTPDGDATRARLTIDYEIEVPLIGALIKGVIAKLMRGNCEGMLTALAQAAESSAGNA